MKKKIMKVYLSTVLLAFANLSNAALVKIEFVGTIDQVDAGSYSAGQQVSGFLVYDTDTSISSYPTGSPPFTTNFNGAIYDFELESQKIDYVTSNTISQTSFSNPVDYKMSFKVAGFDDSTGLRENLDLDFRGVSLLDNIYQILADPNLTDMSSSTFGYTLQRVGLSDGFLQERFYGSVNSLTVTSVPLPAALPLLLAGIASLMISRKVFS